MRDILSERAPSKPRPGRRGLEQRGRREIERVVRQDAVEFAREAKRKGGLYEEAADILRLSSRTLSEWKRRVTDPSRPGRGRPPERSGLERRNVVIGEVKRLGPAVGVGTVRSLFPDVSRSEADEILKRYRVLYLRERSLLIHQLKWLVPGTVWAMDHTVPDLPVDGCARRILSVRDLATGYQLSWAGVESESAEATQDVLDDLFSKHGAPLVLKSDNGSGFRSEAMEDFIASQSVTALPSPPRTPQYNGACERSIGVLKDRTASVALARGSRTWTTDDLDDARRLSNALGSGTDGSRSRAAAWCMRTAVDNDERRAFAAQVERRKVVLGEANGYGRSRLDRWAADEVHRSSVRRTLVACGLLEFRRRRIPLPNRSVFRARIT